MANAPSITIPRWVALVVGAVAFALYLVTCSPTINFTDSGELVTVAWTGGIAHPPGYPLYTLIGTAALQLPFGEPAWRMNVVSPMANVEISDERASPSDHAWGSGKRAR